jgi:hypothetical protein
VTLTVSQNFVDTSFQIATILASFGDGSFALGVRRYEGINSAAFQMSGRSEECHVRKS